jgi:hypothetical protein
VSWFPGGAFHDRLSCVVETQGLPQRALLADARGDERYLRVSWHPDDHQFVVSTWDGERCLGTVHLLAEAAPALIALLAEGVAQTTGLRQLAVPPPSATAP